MPELKSAIAIHVIRYRFVEWGPVHPRGCRCARDVRVAMASRISPRRACTLPARKSAFRSIVDGFLQLSSPPLLLPLLSGMVIVSLSWSFSLCSRCSLVQSVLSLPILLASFSVPLSLFSLFSSFSSFSLFSSSSRIRSRPTAK